MVQGKMYINDGYIEQEKQRSLTKKHGKNKNFKKNIIKKLGSILITVLMFSLFITLMVSQDTLKSWVSYLGDSNGYVDNEKISSSSSSSGNFLIDILSLDINTPPINNNNKQDQSISGDEPVKELRTLLTTSSGQVIVNHHGDDNNNNRLIQADGVLQLPVGVSGAPIVKDSIEKGIHSSSSALSSTIISGGIISSSISSISSSSSSSLNTKPTDLKTKSSTSNQMSSQNLQKNKNSNDNNNDNDNDGSLFNVVLEVTEILYTSPVVIFGNKNDQDSTYLYNLLTKEYEISPEPIFVDLVKHSYGDEIKQYIQLKLDIVDQSIDVPYLFINNIPIINNEISIKDIKLKHTENKLVGLLKNSIRDNVFLKKIESPSNT